MDKFPEYSSTQHTVPVSAEQETPVCGRIVLAVESLPQNWSHISGRSTPSDHEELTAGT